MSSTLLIILLVFLVLGGGWGYTAGPWRGSPDGGPVYWPGGLIGILVLILVLKLIGLF